MQSRKDRLGKNNDGDLPVLDIDIAEEEKMQKESFKIKLNI